MDKNEISGPTDRGNAQPKEASEGRSGRKRAIPVPISSAAPSRPRESGGGVPQNIKCEECGVVAGEDEWHGGTACPHCYHRRDKNESKSEEATANLSTPAACSHIACTVRKDGTVICDFCEAVIAASVLSIDRMRCFAPAVCTCDKCQLRAEVADLNKQLEEARAAGRDRCPSCRVLWHQHPGIQATCGELMEARQKIEQLNGVCESHEKVMAGHVETYNALTKQLEEALRERDERTSKLANYYLWHKNLKMSNDLWGEIMAEIAGTLASLGCPCGPDAHKSTPPMFFPEWIKCVMSGRESRLSLALAALREARTYIDRPHITVPELEGTIATIDKAIAEIDGK